MEFWQFHPTGVAGAGVLITEGVRGEGGILRNAPASASWNATPQPQDLAPRDVVSRAMTTEINEGRGCGPERTTYARPHPPAARDHHEAPALGIREIAIQFAGVDRSRADPVCRPATTRWAASRPTQGPGRRAEKRQPEHPVNGFTPRRMRLRLGARRQPPRHQFAARPAGVRQVGRRDRHLSTSNSSRRHKPLPANAIDDSLARLARLNNQTNGEYSTDRPGLAHDAEARRRVPLRQPCWTRKA